MCGQRADVMTDRLQKMHMILEKCTGFPKKDARFLKIQNITNLLSDDKEGEIMKKIEF